LKTERHSGNKEEAGEILVRSSLYQEFLNERREILRHKWLESEKAGKDIGFENALLGWVRHHRSEWKTRRKRDKQQSLSCDPLSNATCSDRV
jgi:hypothetical protein